MKKYTSIGIIIFCLLTFLGWQLKGALPFIDGDGGKEKTLSTNIDLDMEDTYLKLFRDFKKSELIYSTEPDNKQRRSLTTRRDPFTLPTRRTTQTSTKVGGTIQPKPWRVTGILWDEREPGAVINSKVVGVNSRIGSYRVVSILPEKVVLASGNRELVLNMPPRKSR